MLDCIAACFALPPPTEHADIPSELATLATDADVLELMNNPLDAAWGENLKRRLGAEDALYVTVNRITPSLVVKRPTHSERATLEFVRQNTKIPVPRDHCPHLSYLVMDFIDGEMLYECWDKLSRFMQFRIACTLRLYMKQLCSLTRSTPGALLDGRVGGAIFDENVYGPFPDAQSFRRFCEFVAFHGWKTRMLGAIGDGKTIPSLVRLDMVWTPVLTHGDLNLSNIMLDRRGSLWVMDWANAGFYPPSMEPIAMCQIDEIVHEEDVPPSWRRYRSFIAGGTSAEEEEFWGNFTGGSSNVVRGLVDGVLTIPLTLALHPNNKTGLIDTLMEISDPSSVNYGQHLSKSEVNAFVAPSPESVQATMNWLAKYNVTPQSTSPAGDMLHLRVPIATANAMLSANYQAFMHEALPPINKSPLHTAKPPQAVISTSKRRLVPAVCVRGIQPFCVQALYNLPATPATAPNNSIAVSGFLGEIANQTDLTAFLKTTRPDIENGTFTVQTINGGPTTGAGTLEAMVDIEYTVGLATNVPVQFLSTGGTTPKDFFHYVMDLVNFLLEQDTPPPVLTTSFGVNENIIPPEVAEAVCLSFAQLGARGTSVLFASGDGGVAGTRPNDTCGDDGLFIPVFPATCPFVTTVGSTEGVSPEVAAPFSAGGFSNVFPRPAYQAAAVLGYLNAINITNDSSTSPLAGRFNITGRVFPDVATQGRDIAIVAAGQSTQVFGTSASSPMFASVVALVNDQLLNAGRPTLGFLNPLLYSRAAAAGVFNDITVGSNVGCGTAGFPALPGWDAITGLGTPDYVKLLAMAMGRNQSTL
ncbi:hypothetical protein GSI_05329 [Ganoderma sinense ZZ0214-1]|uniref:Peptidase S53 domain-containing protein n=1 Tax=Ganoderma sinense ZZ0214-1 TaxID=1077348 RepID=A0A2G8SFS1_9APHY|nr:hypothetical protein GSI_05329 [Ganoderma sinense ZZ0214-1]